MSEYKWQHFLPAVYLKNFSPNPELGRKSVVWRFDGKKMCKVSVETQCAGNYFYSKKKPEETEKQFGVTEGVYQKCVRLIKENKRAHPNDYFSFILIIFDLHVRNAIYENKTGEEEIDAYSVRLALLQRGLLLGRSENEEVTERDAILHMQKYWRVCVLSPSIGSGFITSDNPSLLFALSENGTQVDMAMLPISPFHLAVAFDRRVVGVVGNSLTPSDEVLLNGLQIRHCYRCVYCIQHFEENERELLARYFQDKSPDRPQMDEEGWNARVIRLPRTAQFSFVRFRPPLL